jgi:low temperature requirement protein LtrA
LCLKRLIFAGAYVVMQLGRTLYVVSALGGDPGLRRNLQRILAWLAASRSMWLAGGLAEGAAGAVAGGRGRRVHRAGDWLLHPGVALAHR